MFYQQNYYPSNFCGHGYMDHFFAEMMHPTHGKGEKLSNDGNKDVIMTLGATKRSV